MLTPRASTPRGLHFKAEPLDAFEVDAAEGVITGYAARFNVRDRVGDVILPGAFAKSLADRMPLGKIPLLRQHDISSRIGRPLELREDGEGLWGRFKISKTILGRDELILIADGVVNTFSFGYSIPVGGAEIKTQHPAGVLGVAEGEPSRYLQELDIKEVSTVVLSIEDGAIIESVKAEEELKLGGLNTLSSLLNKQAWIEWIEKFGAKLTPEAEKVALETIARLRDGEKSLTAALEKACALRDMKVDANGIEHKGEASLGVCLKLLTEYDPLRSLR